MTFLPSPRRPLGVILILLLLAAGGAWTQSVDASSSASRTAGSDATTSASRTAADATTAPTRTSVDATSSASKAPGTPFDIAAALYDFAGGTGLIIAVVIGVLGIAYRVLQYRRLTRRVPTGNARVAAPRTRRLPRGTSHPAARTASLVFHLLLFLVPLLLPAHNMLLARGVRASLPAIPVELADPLTAVFIGVGASFLVRRIILPRVRVLSTAHDYGVLLLVLAPFVTGFMAHHHLGNWRLLMTIHMLSADALLIAIPFTRLAHMPFLLFSRLFVSGEYAWGPARRAWGSGR